MFNAANLLFMAFARVWAEQRRAHLRFPGDHRRRGGSRDRARHRRDRLPHRHVTSTSTKWRLLARMSAVHHGIGARRARIRCCVALWLLPLAARSCCGRSGRSSRALRGWLGSGLIAASFVLALLSWTRRTQRPATRSARIRRSFVVDCRGFDFGLLFDPLSLLWTLIITGVGFLIHVYSIGYMDGDGAFARFFAYMNFFVFAMLTLVLSDNFVGLLVGWGLVGLASYFLIGFWFEQPVGGRGGAQSVRHQRRRRRRHHVRGVRRSSRRSARSATATCSRRAANVRARRCCSRSASRCSSAARRSRRRFRCTPGCPTRWKARRRSRR